jgi:hypothetical protein
MKEWTSNVEDPRIEAEEPFSRPGRNVVPSMIWRDGALLPTLKPGFSPTGMANTAGIDYAFMDTTFLNGNTEMALMRSYDRYPVTRIPGSLTYYGEELKDIICEWLDMSYAPQIFVGANKLVYGRGQPEFDPTTGCLRFNDAAFIEANKANRFYVSFAAYRGRKGFIGDDGHEFPLPDDITLLKSAADDTKTASFTVTETERYVLPPSTGLWVTDPATILVDGNFNAVVNLGSKSIDGGKWGLDNPIPKYVL